ncbi:Oidioi.mRNA.OKI2018_I69.PAR.g8607.t1.cds [Oikopleura dioica]|uniref:Oidioi.mRNA.OKI2018_I69.PAR.g8607.t1.cds n=1 Tax=Oikopleura dioica TaxID=34765 RepID=A0ABN7RJ92_OIKDI|nr:Oidioi.mRNA.OKI2018_I69.PAR.g8607.t1.cds [Oikopleura dioica]
MAEQTLPTGKTFTLSTTLDQNPFYGPILPSTKPLQKDSLPFTKDIVYDPVIGRQIFVQQTPWGPIATVPTVLPAQVVNVTDAYNATVKKLINHVPTSSAILRDTKVLARRQKDGLYYPATVADYQEGNIFIVEFDKIGEGDFCLAPIEEGPSAYVVGKIQYADEIDENKFRVQFFDNRIRDVPMEDVCWIPDVLYDRVVAELRSPNARVQTIAQGMNTGVESHAVYHPLDIFLNGTPKYTLPGSGVVLSPNVISRVWNPMSYQGVRYIPTYPVPWLPNFWPQDVTMWPQCLLPFRRTFAAVNTNERLPGLNMSVNELDQKVNSTLEGSKTVMEKTSGSYLDRINSFLEETENDVLKDILADKNEGEYEVDVDFSALPSKETCDVGENTIVSLRNRMCKKRWRARKQPEERKPWVKYFRTPDEEIPRSVFNDGTYKEKERPYGYSDDDYTLWRLRQKQISTLENLHKQKADFIAKETAMVQSGEQTLLNKIEKSRQRVDKAKGTYVA